MCVLIRANLISAAKLKRCTKDQKGSNEEMKVSDKYTGSPQLISLQKGIAQISIFLTTAFSRLEYMLLNVAENILKVIFWTGAKPVFILQPFNARKLQMLD